MTAQFTQQAPFQQNYQPTQIRVDAEASSDGRIQVMVNGSSPRQLSGANLDDARRVVMEDAIATARRAGQPVQLHTIDPAGEWWFTVTPAGDVNESDPPVPASPPTPPAPQPRPEAAPEAATAQAPVADQAGQKAPLAPDAAPAATPGPVSTVPAGTQPAPAHTAAAPAAPTGPIRAATPVASGAPVGPAGPTGAAPRHARPTATDLRSTQPTPPSAPAEWGWRGRLHRLTGGALKFTPGRPEIAHRGAIAQVRKNFTGPKTIVVANPKGGAAKTPTVSLLAATFGQQRGGYTLAWDNNESHGTLGERSLQTRHANTALDLLHDLDGFRNSSAARVGDLDNYIRPQGDGQYDVLASNEDHQRNIEIDADAYNDLHTTLARFYRVIVVDTGNSPIASTWRAAIESADMLVIPSTPRDDRLTVAAQLVDRLRGQGFDQLVDNAVFVLSHHTPGREDTTLTSDATRRAIDHFGQHVRRVVEVPFDPAIDAGGPIEIGRLSTRSREAWLQAAAAVAEGL